MPTKRTPKTDAERIAELEAEGLTTRRIPAALDAEAIPDKPTRRKGDRRTPAEKVAEGRGANRATCLCGCGETPKGKEARYLPGHDARHHAALKAAGKKVQHLLPEEKRAAHAERVRAKRAAKRAAAGTGAAE